MSIHIRQERPQDIQSITDLTREAFANIEYSNQNEHFIIQALRQRNELVLSLVAIEHDQIVGHLAFSPVRLSTGEQHWYGLGPVAVLPHRQGLGIGSALIIEGLNQLKVRSAAGCVVLGDPNYYSKFGFRPIAQLLLSDVPAEYFQAISFSEQYPQAEVFYSDAFYVSE